MRVITRREILRWALGGGIAAFLAACGRRVVPTPTRPEPASSPAAGAPQLAAPGGRSAPTATAGTQPVEQSTMGWSPGKGTVSTTPNDMFYTVDIGAGRPRIDLSTWRLEIGGAVENPRSFTMDEVQALPRVTEMRTLECISNPVGGSLIGNAVWEGTRMSHVLDMVGVSDDAVELMVWAADGFFSSIPIDLARREHALLVWSMNGEPLPRDHGFPLRCLWPGRYGMKQPRWITKMEVLTESKRGYWELQGWSNEAVIKPNSQIRGPRAGHQVMPLKPLTIRGTAFSGEEGIARVEVSTDNGKSWLEAELTRGPAPVTLYVWTEWAFDWTPAAPGSYVLQVRVTDNAGHTQKEVGRSLLGGTYPDGTDRIHAVTVQVRKS